MAEIRDFIQQWSGRGYEKGETQSFWLGLLREVFGIDSPEKFIKFEVPVKLKHTNFIDAFVPAAKVIIEQKSLGSDLIEASAQSDGNILTPYEQAQRYGTGLPYSMRPRWIIVCNFAEFFIYDMETLATPEIVLLKDLAREYYRLQFLVDNTDRNIQREEEISLKVGEIVAKLYDVLKKQYHEPDSDESLNNLNKLCVRLVFCMYSESAGIFGKHKLFRDYLNKESNTRVALIRLFKVLNTPHKDRDPYLEKPLSDFPYVNGGLFDDDNSVIPTITDEIRNLIVINAGRIDWSDISPTIFGAIFESTLNPATHKGGGMHYTSVENIHKLIDPLFMDDLREEFEACDTEDKLRAFQNKLASLKFLDPACGSGNFLTETYLSLRRLENDVLRKLQQLEGTLFEAPVKVSIAQFYGIEINDFAVAVAQVALWIAESQMIAETSKIIHRNLNFLPLKTNAHIIEANALRMDWHDIAPSVDYVMGNPPFSGARVMTPAQKSDVNNIFAGWKNIGNLDYVSCWYKKAADFINNTMTRAALISTSSICQGDSVAILWKPLFDANVHIDFAHRSFKWDSESTQKAHVYCVIVAFSTAPNPKPKIIFDGDTKIIAQNINAYLQDAPNIFIEAKTKALCNVPEIANGNKPLDNAICAFTTKERDEFIKREPRAKHYFHRYMGGREFINNIERWILLLNRIPPNELRKMPHALNLIEAIRQYRLSSHSKITRDLAETPTKFHFENMPTNKFLVIPQTSSGRRRYIPIGFLTPDIITNNKLQIMRDGGLYEMGVLSSNVHNSWLRMVAGRLGDGFSYSISIVYNNFPWCTPTAKQQAYIESTAQQILDVRANFPNATLADLYDDNTMPIALRDAHQANDRAVMAAYGFRADLTESKIVTELMKMYQTLTL